MWVETSIALRFLRQGRAQTLLILVGIAVGVSVIVFVVALIAGLQANIIDRTLGTQSHLRVEAPEEINRIAPAPPGTLQLVLEDRRPQTLRPINNWQQVRDVLERLPGIAAVSPIVSGPAFGRRGEAVESVALIGMDLPRYLRVIPLHNHMVDGRLEAGSGNAVIGRQLARDLGLRSGGKLRLEAGDGRNALVNVAGIFELGVRELDARYVYLDLRQAQSLLGLPGAVTVIDATVADLDEAHAQTVTTEITDAGGKAHAFRVDVADAKAVAAMVGFAVEKTGALHGIVNNAGIGGLSAPTVEYTVEAWQKVIDINLSGAFYGMRFAIPEIARAGGGAVVNVASILGSVGFANSSAYVSAKHGLLGATKNAALEPAADGVRVNAVGPGFIHTPLVTETMDAATLQLIASKHALNRLGTSEEVAALILFLLSDRASFITGSYHLVDGGYTAQ